MSDAIDHSKWRKVIRGNWSDGSRYNNAENWMWIACFRCQLTQVNLDLRMLNEFVVTGRLPWQTAGNKFTQCKFVRTKSRTESKFSKTILGLLCTWVIVVVHLYCTFSKWLKISIFAAAGKTVHWIKKWFAPFRIATTFSISMQSLGRSNYARRL